VGRRGMPVIEKEKTEKKKKPVLNLFYFLQHAGML
jgi:hypothetical protein